MSLSANAIQEALYKRIASQLAPTPVYDHTPQDSPFPYVMIGADTSIAWDTQTEDGQQYTCTIHCWDALKAGRKGVKALMERIYASLHRREEALALAGLVEMACEYTETFQEATSEANPDKYYHGVMRFRALIQS